MTTFTKAGLERLRERMAAHAASGAAPGIVTLLAGGDGEVHLDAFGGARPDSLFRISSMTKPVTAVAALLLAEECRLHLDDPVSRWLPELANLRVLRAPDAEVDDTVPARRPITVRDALDFRLGAGMILTAEAFGYPVFLAAQKLGIAGYGPPSPALPHTRDEWLARFATLPLVAQPGERWLYNIGSHVVGALIERVTGQTLEEFYRERVFEPLGMHDTFFTVPAGKAGRLLDAHVAGEDGSVTLYEAAADSAWLRPPAFADAAAGLVSTAGDYLAFARMLLRQGEPLLSRRTVQTMTAGQLTPAQSEQAFGGASTWGLGVAIATRRSDLWNTPGRYGWDGGLGTSWWNDPAEGVIGILLTQRLQFPTENPVYLDFWTSAATAPAR